MKAKCSNCKYYERLHVPGNPYDHQWRCTKSDAVKIQVQAGWPLNMERDNMPCFEPRGPKPRWRFPAAIAVGIFLPMFSFVAMLLVIGTQDFRPLPLAVPIIVGAIAIALGVSVAVFWYRDK
jgi:hypothetical protein